MRAIIYIDEGDFAMVPAYITDKQAIEIVENPNK
jgi:hypothetical protein